MRYAGSLVLSALRCVGRGTCCALPCLAPPRRAHTALSAAVRAATRVPCWLLPACRPHLRARPPPSSLRPLRRQQQQGYEPRHLRAPNMARSQISLSPLAHANEAGSSGAAAEAVGMLPPRAAPARLPEHAERQPQRPEHERKRGERRQEEKEGREEQDGHDRRLCAGVLRWRAGLGMSVGRGRVTLSGRALASHDKRTRAPREGASRARA